MFGQLGTFISKHWLFTILCWVALVIVVRQTTPKWDSVTHDGDLAYMPASMPSVQGERLLQEAFPDGRAKSEVVVVLAREDRPIDQADLAVVRNLVSRFQTMLGTSCAQRVEQLRQQLAVTDDAADDGAVDDSAVDDSAADDRAAETSADPPANSTAAPTDRLARQEEKAIEAFNTAIDLDETNAVAAHNLAWLYQRQESPSDAVPLRRLAWDIRPELQEQADELVEQRGILPLIDVWSRYTDQIGNKMVSQDGQADLIFLRLSDEFMAVENISLLNEIQQIIDETQAQMSYWPAGLTVGLSGSAAVGSDMLRSAAESISNTELYTIILVIGILLIVYRSPLLVAVPLISIVVSLLVATGVVALLTTLNQYPGMGWWNFKIFTTTKIFVIVILFGAGTDYCLFLISRYKEELDSGKNQDDALSASLGGVGEALAASALTTIVGLATMYFADFGKFRNSGPAIGLCLFITLLACLTLAPALLRAMGKAVYWRIGQRLQPQEESTEAAAGATETWLDRRWEQLARFIVAKPAWILVTSTAVMLPFFVLGFDVAITYDLLSELSPDLTSKRGTALLRNHFHVGESGPVVVVVKKENADFDSTAGREALYELTQRLYIDGVQSVRSLVAPIGQPLEEVSDFRRLLRQSHRITRELYVSQQDQLKGSVTRLELVLDHDPFSIEATNVLQQVDETLDDLASEPDSFWADSQFAFAGTTAAIRDLREVTTSDNFRIQVLVVLAVLGILLILLRRPAVCIYLILSVLFSYYVTIGATELYFSWAYGDTFSGLDWKVPLFLFVILVAIGQDYNIYLVTRVFEEQKIHGLMGGLQQAIVRTGGIITSCGVIMAGTFLSMTTGSMRGIVELGFALTLGVLLDTFVVRPILVPAFLAILFRFHADRQSALSSP